MCPSNTLSYFGSVSIDCDQVTFWTGGINYLKRGLRNNNYMLPEKTLECMDGDIKWLKTLKKT